MPDTDYHILHIDMDAFYASVEERENPQLRGKPLAVGGAESRGVVATANYVARRYGVRSAMPMRTALKLCPSLTVLTPRMALYREVSGQIHEIFARYTPCIETIGLDEAFLDPTGSERLHGPAERVGREIKRAIREELELGASVGVAANKLLAKLASAHAKPDGFMLLESEAVESFLAPLPVSDLPGIGKVAAGALHGLAVHTVSDMRQLSEDDLKTQFGVQGSVWWRYARGLDDRKVETGGDPKSFSRENTFSEDITTEAELQNQALRLTENLASRLRRSGWLAGGVQVKVRFSNFSELVRSHSLGRATAGTRELWRVVRTLLRPALSRKPLRVRLLGIGFYSLRTTGRGQRELWDDAPDVDRRNERLDQLADQLNDRYGGRGLRRGGANNG